MDGKRRLLGNLPYRIFFAFLFIAATTGPSALAQYGGGSGTAGDPYQITEPNDLMVLSQTSTDWDKHFKLIADIDLQGFTYTTALIAPDTNSATPGYEGTAFTGSFDGSGYRILNLTVDTLSDADPANDDNFYLGLIGQIGSTGQANNVVLENIVITSTLSHLN